MNPEDIVWRILDRLQESKEIFASCLEGLHPVKDKELIDAITEIEQLTQTQINICRRVQRRMRMS
ncbi:MAG TPA: hypothetical protein VK101_03155 [Limnochordia bacterium]|nr:hypothetical protein [Limnochordia bacterium]